MPDNYEYHIGKKSDWDPGRWEHAEHMTIERATPVRIRVEKVRDVLEWACVERKRSKDFKTWPTSA